MKICRNKSKLAPEEAQELVKLRKDAKRLNEELRILKGGCVVCEKNEIKYAWIQKHKEELKVKSGL